MGKYANKRVDSNSKNSQAKAKIEEDYKKLEDILQQSAILGNMYKSMSCKLEQTLKGCIESLLLHSDFDFMEINDLKDEKLKLETLKSSLGKARNRISHKSNILLEEFLDETSESPLSHSDMEKIYKKLLSHLRESDKHLPYNYDIGHCSFTTPKRLTMDPSRSFQNIDNNFSDVKQNKVPQLMLRKPKPKNSSKSMWNV